MTLFAKNRHKLLFAAIELLLAVTALLAFRDFGIDHAVPWLLLLAAIALPLVPRSERCANFVVWRPDYAIGIQVIDEEHKTLLTLINSLLAAVHCNTGEEFEQHALNELVAYTKYHFSREEELMAKYDFPDYEGHKAQHDQMIMRVESFLKRYEQRGRKALEEVAAYLKLWLVQHILGTDRKYGPYLHERGVH